MRRLAAIFCLLPAMALAQAVPASRRADANWAAAGVTPNGGIPARSTICATVNASTYNNGADDATAGIQAAIDACTAGQTVSLSAGTFRVLSTLTITKAITLRGAGAGVTILEKTNGAYKPAGDWPQSQPTPANEAAIIRVGNYGEVKKIVAIDGTTVTFSSPFTDTYRTSHDAEIATNDTTYVTGAGVEALTLFRGSRGAIEFMAAADSWVKDVEIVEWLGHGVQIVQSHRIEVTGCYIHRAAWPVPGGGGYAIALEDQSSEVLITNTISIDANKNIVANSGGAGSVVSYSYFDDSFIWYDLTWQEVSANASHFAGPHHVLFEGNRAVNFDSDFTHGSAYSHTVARNHLTGTRTNYAGTVNARTIGLGIAQLNMSAVGNVLGQSGAMSGWVLTDDGDFWTDKFLYKIGYDAGDPWWSGDPPTVSSFVDGDNYNFLNNSIRTAAAASVPSSYYLGAKPAFFGSCGWPWVEATTGTIGTLPAYARFQAGQPNDTATDRCGGRRTRLRLRGE